MPAGDQHPRFPPPEGETIIDIGPMRPEGAPDWFENGAYQWADTEEELAQRRNQGHHLVVRYKHRARLFAAKKFEADEDDRALGQWEATAHDLLSGYPGLMAGHACYTPDGCLWLFTPWQNESLRTRLLKTGKVPVKELAKLADAALLAKRTALLQVGVATDDERPENVSGQLVSIDYGCWKAPNEPSTTADTVYAPSGDRSFTAGEHDVYALGVMLFECLEGSVPLAADRETLDEHELRRRLMDFAQSHEDGQKWQRCIIQLLNVCETTLEKALNGAYRDLTGLDSPKPTTVRPISPGSRELGYWVYGARRLRGRRYSELEPRLLRDPDRPKPPLRSTATLVNPDQRRRVREAEAGARRRKEEAVKKAHAEQAAAIQRERDQQRERTEQLRKQREEARERRHQANAERLERFRKRLAAVLERGRIVSRSATTTTVSSVRRAIGVGVAAVLCAAITFGCVMVVRAIDNPAPLPHAHGSIQSGKTGP